MCVISPLAKFVCQLHCVWKEGKRQVRERGREMLRECRKQHYQRRASKTISYVSWVICDPAFFRLQRAAVCWNTASGRVKGGRRGSGGGGESDFSNKCWHQACLILDSGNSLICYRLWNSSDVLQRGRMAAPSAGGESAECQADSTVVLL